MKNFKITISKPALGDKKDLVFILKITWLHTYPCRKLNITKKDILTKNFDSPKKLLAWRKAIKESGKKLIYICVAKHNKKIIGFCKASKGKNYNKIDVLYVLPEYHGMGVGKRLLGSCLKWLGRSKKIQLTVASHNKNAIKFYEKQGFIINGEVKKKRLINGKIMPENYMVLI